MRRRFPRCHSQHLGRNRTLEQSGEYIYRAARLREQCLQPAEAVDVRLNQFVDTRVETNERTVVRRKNQHVVRYARLDPGERIEPITQGVGFGLGGIHGNIGGDPRKNLIS